MKQVYISYIGKDKPLADEYLYCPYCQAELVMREIDHRQRAACPTCGFIHFQNPSPTISLVIVKNKQVLLGKRSSEPGLGRWATPSGYIEYEGDFLTTAIREAKEETGLDVEIEGILNVTSSFISPAHHFLNIYLLARVTGGELAAADDLGAAAWFPLAGPLPELEFQEDVDLLSALSKHELERLPVDQEYAR